MADLTKHFADGGWNEGQLVKNSERVYNSCHDQHDGTIHDNDSLAMTQQILNDHKPRIPRCIAR